MTVLIVEDDFDAADAMQHLLQCEGIDAQCANDLPSALIAVAHDPPPDAVLLDLILPPPNDVDATLAALPTFAARSVVVVVSGRSDRRTIDAALAAGATRYWLKGDWRPPERMKTALLRCVEQRRLKVRLAEVMGALASEDVPDPLGP